MITVTMNPIDIQVFLNEINGDDDIDSTMLKTMAFSDQVNMELVERWDVDNEPPQTWTEFEQLWLNTYFPWIGRGNGILLMWSKDSDSVFPYVWWYIGYDTKQKRWESSSWLITGNFTQSNNVVKTQTCNWFGKNLVQMDEKVCAQMLDWGDDWSGELQDDIAVVWANCSTGLNVWKTTMSQEEIMRKTLNWSNANIEFLLR